MIGIVQIPPCPPFSKGGIVTPAKAGVQDLDSGLRRNDGASPFAKGGLRGISLLLALVTLLFLAGQATAYTGRRAVLYSEALVMLEINELYKRGSADCSMQMWKLLRKVFPELRVLKWFKRTTAEAMATWPWAPLLSLRDLMFGDLIFANSRDDDPRTRSPKEEFRIRHVLMSWDEPDTAVHASEKRGFSKTNLRPFWMPRINLAIRPPY